MLRELSDKLMDESYRSQERTQERADAALQAHRIRRKLATIGTDLALNDADSCGDGDQRAASTRLC